MGYDSKSQRCVLRKVISFIAKIVVKRENKR
jgi:hypothetical protein